MRAIILLLVMAVLGACTSSRLTLPDRTATEQLLISNAVDRAVQNLPMNIGEGVAVHVDASYLEGYDVKYAVGSVRDRILKLGGRLVADRQAADAVVELRAGALSVDEEKVLVGIPSFEFPIPFTDGFKLPEIALFKKHQLLGVAKIAATGYDTGKGSLRGSWGPTIGQSHRTEWTVLLFVSWVSDDIRPDKPGLLDPGGYL